MRIVPPEKINQVIALLKEGKGGNEILKQTGCSYPTIDRISKQYGLPFPVKFHRRQVEVETAREILRLSDEGLTNVPRVDLLSAKTRDERGLVQRIFSTLEERFPNPKRGDELPAAGQRVRLYR